MFLVYAVSSDGKWLVSRALAPDSFGKESGNFSRVSVCAGVRMLTPRSDI